MTTTCKQCRILEAELATSRGLGRDVIKRVRELEQILIDKHEYFRCKRCKEVLPESCYAPLCDDSICQDCYEGEYDDHL